MADPQESAALMTTLRSSPRETPSASTWWAWWHDPIRQETDFRDCEIRAPDFHTERTEQLSALRVPSFPGTEDTEPPQRSRPRRWLIGHRAGRNAAGLMASKGTTRRVKVGDGEENK